MAAKEAIDDGLAWTWLPWENLDKALVREANWAFRELTSSISYRPVAFGMIGENRSHGQLYDVVAKSSSMVYASWAFFEKIDPSAVASSMDLVELANPL